MNSDFHVSSITPLSLYTPYLFIEMYPIIDRKNLFRAPYSTSTSVPVSLFVYESPKPAVNAIITSVQLHDQAN